jgi:hypothetical protein
LAAPGRAGAIPELGSVERNDPVACIVVPAARADEGKRESAQVLVIRTGDIDSP